MRGRAFPLRLVFDVQAKTQWMRGYVSTDSSRWDTWASFEEDVLKNVNDYKLPVIRLAKETPKEAVCTVFEKVNTGGVALNVFELLTATYAGDPDYFAGAWRGFPASRPLASGTGRTSST